MKNAAAAAKFVKKVQSSSNPEVKHTITKKNGKLQCSCIGFKIRKTCKHINPTKPNMENNKMKKHTAKPTSKKLVVPTVKSTRAAMIGILLRNKGRLVTQKMIVDAVCKMTGMTEKRAAARVRVRIPGVKAFAKVRGAELIVNKAGLKLAVSHGKKVA